MVAMLRRQLAMLKPGPAALATTANDRTRGSAWQAKRAAAMRRDGGLCVYCRPFGHLTIGAEVDHRRPLWAGGTDAPGNLATSCADHHRAKTRAEEALRLSGQAWQPWEPAPIER